MKRSRAKRRSGYALLVVLAIFLVISVVMAALLRSLSEQRASAIRGGRQLQSICLAEAGLERGIARLQANRGYHGEQWEVTAEELRASRGGVVTIEVQRSASNESVMNVHVVAEYPQNDLHRVRTEKRIAVTLPALENHEESNDEETP